ncbi:MAG: YdcH family protein [Sphingobium sp.]|nr:YdcH family protein [Sphingobium sp.]
MSENFLTYLKREHDRLEAEIEKLSSRRLPDTITIARLKKQKLAVKDQIAQWQRDCSVAA